MILEHKKAPWFDDVVYLEEALDDRLSTSAFSPELYRSYAVLPVVSYPSSFC